MAQIRLIRWFSWLALLLSLECVSWGQTYPSKDFVEFQGAQLQLGMAMEDVSTALVERNLQLRMPEGKRGDWYNVVNADGRILGRIRFAAGKVFIISKDFDLQKNPAGTLLSLLQELISEGKRNCALDSETKTDVTRGTQVAYISCGTKSLKVHHRATAEPLSAIEEVLER